MPWKSNSSTEPRTIRSSSAKRCKTQRSSSGIASVPTASDSEIAVERPEQIAQGVAQAAIGVAVALQDLRADADIFGIIRSDHPEPQDVRAALLHDLLRRDDVAERFRHLAPVFVEHETMGQHRFVGRPSAGAAGLDQRRLEPAAVLVRPFEIKVGGPTAAPAAAPARKRESSPNRTTPRRCR